LRRIGVLPSGWRLVAELRAAGVGDRAGYVPCRPNVVVIP
jgi:hypothetical protein